MSEHKCYKSGHISNTRLPLVPRNMRLPLVPRHVWRLTISASSCRACAVCGYVRPVRTRDRKEDVWLFANTDYWPSAQVVQCRIWEPLSKITQNKIIQTGFVFLFLAKIASTRECMQNFRDEDDSRKISCVHDCSGAAATHAHSDLWFSDKLDFIETRGVRRRLWRLCYVDRFFGNLIARDIFGNVKL